MGPRHARLSRVHEWPGWTTGPAASSHPTFASHYAAVRERPRRPHHDATGMDGQFHLVCNNG
jgi:hypothetical protein